MEKIYEWSNSGFSVTLWDTGRPTGRIIGRTFLKYQFKDGDKVLFEGEEFQSAASHCDDSIHSVMALLSFIALGVGDVDSDYFSEYTPEQLEWRDSERREELDLLVLAEEERLYSGKVDNLFEADKEGRDEP